MSTYLLWIETLTPCEEKVSKINAGNPILVLLLTSTIQIAHKNSVTVWQWASSLSIMTLKLKRVHALHTFYLLHLCFTAILKSLRDIMKLLSKPRHFWSGLILICRLHAIFCRCIMESLIMWRPEDAHHPGRPGCVDQCCDHPPLGLGHLPPYTRGPQVAPPLLPGPPQRHRLPPVSFTVCVSHVSITAYHKKHWTGYLCPLGLQIISSILVDYLLNIQCAVVERGYVVESTLAKILNIQPLWGHVFCTQCPITITVKLRNKSLLVQSSVFIFRPYSIFTTVHRILTDLAACKMTQHLALALLWIFCFLTWNTTPVTQWSLDAVQLWHTFPLLFSLWHVACQQKHWVWC